MFNAWCDRMPVVVLGATGPVDAVKRRPWIDWIHTARDQGALVREYTKWDDQPASPGAAREAILRGTWIANTAPQGPVYINLDAEVQEEKVSEQLPPIDVARYMPPISTAAPAEQVKQAAALLKGAKQVLILAGRSSRDPEAWKARVALAEALNARVLSDLKIGASFPTDHPLYFGSPRAVTPEGVEGLKDVDVVLSLDWVDLAGALRWFGPSPSAKVIQITRGFRRSISCSPPIPIWSCRNWSRKSAPAPSRMPCRARARSSTRSRRVSPTRISRVPCAKCSATGR
jgi:acetolactate synthase I/II/III large subunit